jgi:hypothetical protein
VSQGVECHNCGAPMQPRPDGRTHACQYCRTVVQVAIDEQQIAAGLKVDLSNIDAFLARLASSLHDALGERVRVQHSGGRIAHLEVNLDPDVFIARHEPHGVVCQYRKLVRGVALKTATHPVDHWVEMLMKALAGHSNENARVAQALTRIRGG